MNPSQTSFHLQLHKTTCQAGLSGLFSKLTEVITAFAFGICLSSCASPPPTHISGRVLDVNTKAPIEGAYVLATYERTAGSWYVGSSSTCVATAGMVTGKDGAFTFPYQTKTGATIKWAYAVKTGYFHESEAAAWDKKYTPPHNKYNNWEVFLVKQEVAVKRGVSQIKCVGFESREAALANIEFLKLTLAEQKRISRPAASIDQTQNTINELLEITDATPANK